MDAIARLLDGNDEVSRVRQTATTQPGYSVVIAIVEPRAIDELLGDLRRLGVPVEDVTLTREEGARALERERERGRARLGGRARDGFAELPTDRAVPRVHARGGRDRQLRSVGVQRDPDRRRDGDQ